MNYWDLFPQRLRKARQDANKTQKDMSIALNIARESYNAYETGKAKPTFDNLMKIQMELNISLDYLVGLKEDKLISSNSKNINNNGIINNVNM